MMSKFEPKIHPTWREGKSDCGVMWVRMDEAERHISKFVTDNLRRFKAEFLRRYGINGTGPTAVGLFDAMLPDDPPKATGDDARDAERWRFLVSYKGTILNGCGVFALLDAGIMGHDVGYHYSLREAIDAAMAREREAK